MNEEINRQIMQASFSDKNPAEYKNLYVERNAYGIGPDEPIYRIFQLEFLINDILKNVLTHVHVRKRIWGDDLDNPIFDHVYHDESDGIPFTLNGVIGNYFALCWTYESEESSDAWDKFSYDNDAVRVKTTPRKLLGQIMNDEDKFFMLHHQIRKVKYLSSAKIKEWVKSTHYTSHLDSQGHAAAVSLTTVNSNYHDEKEVRLLYNHIEHSDNPWIKKNVLVDGDLW